MFSSLDVSWRPLEMDGEVSMPPRRGHAAAYCPERKLIVVFGGTSGATGNEGLLGDLWTFSLETREWSQLQPALEDNTAASAPLPRRGCSGWMDGGRFYVLGGYTIDPRMPWDPALWALDLDTFTWARQPVPTEGHRVRSATGKFYDIREGWPGPCFSLTTPARIDRSVWFFGGSSPPQSTLDGTTNILYRLDLDLYTWVLFEVTYRS